MVRPGLLLEPRTAIYQAQQQDVTVASQGYGLIRAIGEVRLEVPS